MSFEINSEKTKQHPVIIDFLETVDQVTRGEVLKFVQVQSKELFKYSNSLMIAEFDFEKDDFKFRFCGSNITEYYAMNITGKYISETTDEKFSVHFIQNYKDIMREKKNIFYYGTLQPRGKDYIDWYQVSMPLERNGKVNEVISFVFVDLQI